MAVLPPIDPEEVARLEREFGPCAHLSYDVPMSASSLDYWLRRIPSRRRAEVGMVIVGPDGRVLTHTKPHYPGGTFRILTGGIKPRERVLPAIRREVWEETGLNAAIERLLAVLHYRFTDGARQLPFATYLFLVRSDGSAPSPQDKDERISEFREMLPGDLMGVAHTLESLPEKWDDWGRFRAIANRVAAELLDTKTQGQSG